MFLGRERIGYAEAANSKTPEFALDTPLYCDIWQKITKMEDNPISWLIQNKEWVFSGVGVSALSAVVAFALFFIRKNRGHGVTQNQKGGAFSKNIQINHRPNDE